MSIISSKQLQFDTDIPNVTSGSHVGIMRHRLFGLLWITSLVCSAMLACSTPPRNILLITLDTTRADRLGCYGYRDAHTPVLDSLAKKGTMFLHAYSPVPLTLPAHATIFTGLEPWEHGVRDNGLHKLDQKYTTIAEELSELNYRCVAVVAAYPLIRQYGLAQGFHVYSDNLSGSEDEIIYPERDAAKVTDTALEHIRRMGGDSPVFLWVHYFDPHAPYDRKFGSLEGYDAEIAYMDHHVGRLLASLNRKDWLVCAVGDHGEGLGDHGEKTHGDMLYSSTLNIPLIISGPGWRGGRKRTDPVTLADIDATLSDYAGIQSSKPGLVTPTPLDRTIQAETLHPLLRYGWPPLRSVQKADMKLIAGEGMELYDLSSEAGEDRNIARLFPDTVRVFMEMLPEGIPPARISGLSETDRKVLATLGYMDFDESNLADRSKLLTMLESGNQYAHEGDWNNALKEFRAILKKDPGNLWAQIGVGTSNAKLGHLGRADSCFLALHQQYPSYLPALQNLAMTRLLLGDLATAEQFNRLVLQRMPEDANSLLWLAMILRQQRRFEESRSYYEHFIEIRPYDARVLRDFGSLLAYELKDRDAAISLWERALALDPSLPQRSAMEREIMKWRG